MAKNKSKKEQQAPGGPSEPPATPTKEEDQPPRPEGDPQGAPLGTAAGEGNTPSVGGGKTPAAAGGGTTPTTGGKRKRKNKEEEKKTDTPGGQYSGDGTPENQAPTPDPYDHLDSDSSSVYVKKRFMGKASALLSTMRRYRHERLGVLLNKLPKPITVKRVRFTSNLAGSSLNWLPFTPESIMKDPSISQDELDLRRVMNEDYRLNVGCFSRCDRFGPNAERQATFYLQTRLRWKQLNQELTGPYEDLREAYIDDLRNHWNKQPHGRRTTPFPCEFESEFLDTCRAVLKHHGLTHDDRRRDDDVDSLEGVTETASNNYGLDDDVSHQPTIITEKLKPNSEIIFQMHDPQTMCQLTSLSKADITKWVTSQLMTKNINVPFLDTIPMDVRYQITPFLQVNLDDDNNDYANWHTLPKEELCRLLETANQKVTYSGKSTLTDQIESVKWPSDITGSGWYIYVGKIRSLIDKTSEPYVEATIVEVMRKCLVAYCKTSPNDSDNRYVRNEWDKQKSGLTTISQVFDRFMPTQIKFIKTAKEHADKINYGKGSSRFNDNKPKNPTNSNQGNKHKSGASQKPPSRPTESNPDLKPSKSKYCSGCGRDHKGGFSECNHKAHEHFNTEENVKYEHSTVGKQLATQLGRNLVFRIPLGEKPPNDTRDVKPAMSGNKRRRGNELYNSGGIANTTELINSIKILEPNNIHKPLSNVYIQCVLYSRSQVKEAEPMGMDTVILLDTGANESNYVNKRVADHLVDLDSTIQPCNTTICSGIGNNLCITCHGSIEFYLKFKNTISNEFELILLTAKIIEMTTDIIIGNKLIFSFKPNLIDRYLDWSAITKPHVASETPLNAPTCEEVLCNTVEVLTEADTVMYISPLDHINHTYEQQLEVEDDYDVIPWSDVPRHMPGRNDELPEIQGDEALQQKIINLCMEFKEIFSKELRKEPAKIPPFELIVNVEKWESQVNRLPPRKVGLIKDSEIKRQVDSMIAANVVEESQAPYYSQVLLTPKPNNEWRFCIDYRRLNDATTKLGWPIPNIKHMLRRIGESKSKYYAKIDFTKGYYQAPLSMNSRALTAFICFCGVYQWLRVPMGLKGAPSYFQKEMATLVLGGLIHIILELYIDDILIHGKTEEEFIVRVRTVFERLRKHNITVNPKKCIFGASRIEFVGHEINEKGMTFSKEKIHKVIVFAVPITPKQLQGFLGLANYFRDHIDSFSIKGRPLFEVLIHWNRTGQFIWTKEAAQAFSHIKDAINKCPQLFFVSENGLVYLHTDASKYGIGGYLFQIVDGVEQPIQFISKAFRDAQLNWHTFEKEGYAIVYCIKKLEYLLRDVPFILRTDHKNLTYISDSSSPKVIRWKHDLQEFNYTVEHIPGPQNIAADGFSRLLDTSASDEYNEVNFIKEPARALSQVFQEGIDTVNYISDMIPIPNDKYRLITEVHNSQVGHRGLERTLQLLKQNHTEWPLMRQQVKQFIKNCPCCQKMSYIKYPIHAHPFTLSTYEPFVRIHIDTIGEMPRKDEAGNLYVLVIRDSFSRFTLLYPIADTTAKNAVKCLMHMFGLFGYPAQILSDNGSQFVNEIITEFTKQVQVQHLRTMAYSKEENGLVERANKEVNRYLRDLIYDLRVDSTWSEYIPMIQRIMNSTVNESTGLTPAEIIFGNSIDLDRGMFHPISDVNEQPVIISDWMAKMLETQAKLIALARKKLMAKDEKHIQEYDPTRTEFPINSYVLVTYPVGMNGTRKPPTRFHSILRGPYRVINYTVKGVVTVQNLVTYKNEDFHVTQLRPFQYDPERVDLRDVASRDRKEFVIDRIVSHIGDFKSKRTLQFLVKWLGYDESENTYESFRELRATEQLHAYLIRCGLQKEIPAEFRRNYQLN